MRAAPQVVVRTGRAVLLAAVLTFGAGPAELRAQSPQAPSDDHFIAIGGAAVWALGTALAYDGAARAFFEGDEGEGLASLADVGWQLGRAKTIVPAMGLAWVVGRVTDRSALASAIEHSFFALLASGAVNGALKVSVGRARPDLGRGRTTFDPWSWGSNSWQSFPSGHVVVAFSLATALDLETDSALAAGLGYTSAALVGWSRLYEDRHWLSDVVAGALVGSLTTWQTLEWLHGSGDDGSGGPQLSLHPGGLAVTIPLPNVR